MLKALPDPAASGDKGALARAARDSAEDQDIDELIKDLQGRGLSEEQAKVAAAYIFELMRDEERRKKIVFAAMATTIASSVVTGAI